jgi:hypothetical protein
VFLGLLSIRYQPLRSADEQKPSQFGKWNERYKQLYID